MREGSRIAVLSCPLRHKHNIAQTRIISIKILGDSNHHY
jgi:hypothetical protein